MLLDARALRELRAAGVRDSKLLSPRKREALADLVARKSRVELIELSPAEIDEFRLSKKINLNELEAMKFAEIIERLKPHVAYIDSTDPNPAMFKERILKYLGGGPELVVKNFADRLHTVVSAASLVAKVRRDLRVRELRRKYGDFGSGYPSDPRTIGFLQHWVREYGRLPPFARKSWDTAQRVLKQLRSERGSEGIR